MDLFSLHVMVLQKLPPTYLQNALSTFVIFLTVLFLSKEITSKTEKCNTVSIIMEFTVLSMFSIILKHLAYRKIECL